MSGSTAAPRGLLAELGAKYWKGRVNRGAALVALALVVVAVFADFIASDKPLLLSFRGQFWVFPNLFVPPALRIFDNQLLASQLGPDDWALMPPVRWGYNTHDLDAVLAPPSMEHWLGTDSSGRDVLARLVHGSRVSLAVGALAMLFLSALGTAVGVVAGWFGGWVDDVTMRVLEVVYAQPSLLIMVVMLTLLRPRGWFAVVAMMIVIGLVGWPSVARLVRAEVLRVKQLDFVAAARAQGAGSLRLVLVHVLPSSIGPVLVGASFEMAGAILGEGALSFLGYGIPPELPSWGGLLDDARGVPQAWWVAVFPGLALFLVVVAFNLAGQGIRDAADPRLD